MTRSFHSCDRDQQFLLPPSLDEWLDEDDLAYVIIDAVAQMDLRPFFAKYKDGSGQKAYRPDMLLCLLLMAYCHGERSSRRIEKLCYRDIGYRFITSQCFPDHCTIARFRQKFRSQIKDLFIEVLELCREAGLLKVGIVAIDGTKIAANAAMQANQTRTKLASQVELMLNEAEQIDQAEDKLHGDKKGDELPGPLRSPASRAAAMRAARDRQQRVRKAHEKVENKARDLTQAYENKVAKQREREAKKGKKASKQEEPKPPSQEDLDSLKANTSDPDSRTVKGRGRFLQGYNAQAAVTSDTQIIVATHVTPTGCDTKELPGMIERVIMTLETLNNKSVNSDCALSPNAFVADAGYWSHKALKASHAYLQKFETPAQLYVAVPSRYAKVKDPPADNSPPAGASLIERLEHQQRSPDGQQIYKQRSVTVEPVFGQTKDARGCDRFMQRGQENVDAEWNLICTTHNLLKLWRHKKTQMN
jgi:transposase